jgi:perosamine synthetase
MSEYFNQNLAILGGKSVLADKEVVDDLFHWPIVTEEGERAVLEVLRAGSMSQLGITDKFQDEFAKWMGVEHALGFCNGTTALLAAMWAVGLRRGDELICPSTTYWASVLQTFSLGATPVFADIDPKTLCIDPAGIEQHITPRTKAIMVVHLSGYPCDMDAILPIAKKYNLKVIEDVSHAQGGLYKGKMVGTFGDVAGISMMASKSFAIGEGGMLVTSDTEIHERAIAFGHYARHPSMTIPELKNLAGLPLGAIKGRLNQTCSALGRVQLKNYPAQVAEIQQALNYFWDLLEGTPGIRAHRTAKESGCTMGGWYNPVGCYFPEELGGLPVEKFVEAVIAEGGLCGRSPNAPLHLHPVLNEADIYGDGKPTRIAFSDRDLRQPAGSLPVAERILKRTFGIPYFKRYIPELIEQYAIAFRKVAMQADKLVDISSEDAKLTEKENEIER